MRERAGGRGRSNSWGKAGYKEAPRPDQTARKVTVIAYVELTAPRKGSKLTNRQWSKKLSTLRAKAVARHLFGSKLPKHIDVTVQGKGATAKFGKRTKNNRITITYVTI